VKRVGLYGTEPAVRGTYENRNKKRGEGAISRYWTNGKTGVPEAVRLGGGDKGILPRARYESQKSG